MSLVRVCFRPLGDFFGQHLSLLEVTAHTPTVTTLLALNVAGEDNTNMCRLEWGFYETDSQSKETQSQLQCY